VVVGFDAWALRNGKETLSAYYYRVTPRLVVDAFWVGLSWHLVSRGTHILPDRYHAVYKKVHPLWRLHDVAAGQHVIRIATIDPQVELTVVPNVRSRRKFGETVRTRRPQAIAASWPRRSEKRSVHAK
jgi:hypothetical protein